MQAGIFHNSKQVRCGIVYEWLDTGVLAGSDIAAQAHSITIKPAPLRAGESIRTSHTGIRPHYPTVHLASSSIGVGTGSRARRDEACAIEWIQCLRLVNFDAISTCNIMVELDELLALDLPS